MKPNSNPIVQAWLDRQIAETLFLTATSLSELLVGIQILPDGKRKEGLDIALKELMAELFGSRILSTEGKVTGNKRETLEPASMLGCDVVTDVTDNSGG